MVVFTDEEYQYILRRAFNVISELRHYASAAGWNDDLAHVDNVATDLVIELGQRAPGVVPPLPPDEKKLVQ